MQSQHRFAQQARGTISPDENILHIDSKPMLVLHLYQGPVGKDDEESVQDLGDAAVLRCIHDLVVLVDQLVQPLLPVIGVDGEVVAQLDEFAVQIF